MLPTTSDRKTARIHIILTASFVVVTTLFLISVIIGIQVIRGQLQSIVGDHPTDKVVYDFISSLLSSPWAVWSTLAWSDLGLVDGFALPFWWTLARILNVIAYVLSIGILVTSIMGIRVQKYRDISWTGYLMGIIGSGVSITVVFNVMTWWGTGYILGILSLALTIKTYKQINASLATYGEGQPQQMPTQQLAAQQMQQPFYQDQAAPQYQNQTAPQYQNQAPQYQGQTGQQYQSQAPQYQGQTPQQKSLDSNFQTQAVQPQAQQQPSEVAQAETVNPVQAPIFSTETTGIGSDSQASQPMSDGTDATSTTIQTASIQSEEPKE